MNQEKQNCTEKNTLLDISVSNVFVAKNAKTRAFIEQFEHSSINFTQKELGTILGFFVVRDTSQTSENIVNFLSSEVKKKYFSPIAKNVDEKFEATLHHINRILEEIANIGNIDWIGTIDSAICVINNSSINFSVTGNAHILLLRDNNLIDISEGLASKEASEYPLKTFIDISSGDLCPDDKLIITSPELLEYVSFSELQKNAIHFGHESFLQFIQTVLSNECSMATTTIIDISGKEQTIEPILEPEEQEPVQQTISEPVNAFGANSFEDATQENLEIEDLNTDELLGDVEQDIKTEWTDNKGHIHIQGSDEEIPEQTILESTQEKLSDLTEQIKEFSAKKYKKISKSIAQFNEKRKNKSKQKNEESETINPANSYETNLTDFEEYLDEEYLDIPQSNDSQNKMKQGIYTICSVTKNTTKSTTVKCVQIFTNLRNRLTPTTKNDLKQINKEELETKKYSLLPSINHLTDLWHTMSTQTKLISLGILLAITLVPIFFVLISNNTNTNEINEILEATPTEQTPEQQPIEPISTNTIKNASILFEDTNLVSTLFMEGLQIGISKNSITIFNKTEKETFQTPSDAGEIKLATNMDDLDLIFFLTTSNKLYSFSPNVKKFTQQKNIPLLQVNEIDTLGAFMTYIYTTDNDMIKRYTRQENGFAEAENWLTEKTDLSNTTTIAIDDDIYTSRNGKISKFSKHKKASFSQDATIQNAFLIYTTPDTSNMWVLDKEQKTVFKTKKGTGKKITEFVHEDFSQAISFTVNEKNDKIVISTTDKILEFVI